MRASSILLALVAAVSARKCKDITVPVSLTAKNAVFDLKTPTTQIEVTNLFLNLVQQGRNYAEVIQKGVSTASLILKCFIAEVC